MWIDNPKYYRQIEEVIPPHNEVITRRLYTIGALAEALGKKPVTVRSWITSRVIPESEYRSFPHNAVNARNKAGVRLWTKEQIDIIVRIATEEDVIGKRQQDLRRFAGRVRAAWAYQG